MRLSVPVDDLLRQRPQPRQFPSYILMVRGYDMRTQPGQRFLRKTIRRPRRPLGSILQRRVSPKALAGPIGIAQLSSEAAQQGPLSFLLLMSMVSLNLAIFNLLPIPILDGGTLLLLIIEMLLQREVSLQVKETVFKLGFVFLMAVVAFVLYNDISKLAG